MIKIFFSIFTLITLLVGCKDQVSTINPIDDSGTDSVVIDRCDSTIDYHGISSASDISDTTVRLTWESDPDSIGYVLFKLIGTDFRIVKTFPARQTSAVISGLSAQSDYHFLVRTISPLGHLDCNTTFEDVTTTEKQTFTSCKEIADYYQGVKPSGEYEIDVDLTGPKAPFNVFCEMNSNGGGWTRVFTHNTASGLFTGDTQAKDFNADDTGNDLYSILGKLADFKRDGKFEFWLYYPEHDGVDGGNIWSQTSNPVTELIAGYNPIRITYTDMHWGGLEKSSTSGTLIDGSVSYSWWFYAIGANRYWPSSGTIPGPVRSVGINEVQLFVR